MVQAPVIIEHFFRAPAEKVWHAISDPEAMKQWYFNIPDFKAETGRHFSFEGGPQDHVYIHLCEVTAVIPMQKLQYTWRYKGYEGLSVVTFQVFPEEEGTRLRLTHEGLETFPDNDPAFGRENFITGWTHIIGTSLPGYLVVH